MSQENGYSNWESRIQQGLALCDQMLANGEVGAALAHLRSLGLGDEADTKVVAIQMLHAAGLAEHAYREVKSLVLPADPEPEVLLRLAHVCADAGADADAKSLLDRVVDDALLLGSLYIASRIAERIGDANLRAQFERRMINEHPSESGVRNLVLQRALADERFAEAAAVLHPDFMSSREHLYHLQLLADSDSLDTEAMVILAERSSGKLVPLAILRYLLARHEVVAAINVAILLVGSENEEEVRELLAVLDAFLLRRGSIDFSLVESKVADIIKVIVGYLAVRPQHGYVRQRLIELLSVERSGDMGVPLLLKVVFNLIDEGGLILGPNTYPASSSKEALLESKIPEICTQWLMDRQPCIPGKTKLPRELISIDPDVCMATICTMMSSGAIAVESRQDVDVLKHWLLLGCGIAPHTSAPDFTTVLFRVAMTRLGNAGYAQQARDLCEEQLSQCGDSQSRAQSAWFSMADVYSRLQDRRTSLVAFACAIAGPNIGQTPLTSFNEINLWVRLLRESGLLDHALDALEISNKALQARGTYDKHRHQQLHVRLTIELERVVRDLPDRADEIPNLLLRAAEAGQEALDSGEDGVQAMALLGQLIKLSKTFNVKLPDSAAQTMRVLAGNTFSSKPFVQTLMDSEDPVGALWTQYSSVEPAKFANDAAYDSMQLTVAARMVLTLERNSVEPDELLLPFELLADRGVAAPGWTMHPRPPYAFGSPSKIVEVAEHLRGRGIALVLAAFDNLGQLVSLRYEGGQFTLVEEQEFSYDSFKRWSKLYPYDYCKDVGTQNWEKEHAMQQSLAECKWQTLPSSATLVVMESELRSMPSNLLWTNNGFFGASQPVGAAPSMAWLAESFSRRPAAVPRLYAWISNAGDQTQTLNVLLGYLRGEFEEYGVVLDTSNQPPATLAGSDLVFIAAHGQVSPEGNYFHTLNDEGSLKIPADVVATAVRDSRVAVLFVCSGGRSDKVPDANTTSGLAKELLSKGCSTVIASPWPVEAMVAASWAPKFLKYWKSGKTAIQASHDANMEISGDPSRALAMNLYGDPCQTWS
ncbi:CHAT domain-containing protein [Pseudomonas agarici]|uniref:CHAT domain-containing protein n=1 Tax=Pseudomonas agarici TaxID=46677 RepID=UPI0015A15360|nr:CHAT domain-containing protein [Pseudomonas agarici]NWB93480.1 CHAT domain-containing protein [Pseudomonas agarici]